MKARSSFQPAGDEYDVISFRLSWAGLSLFFFLMTLPTPYLLRWQPWRPERFWLGPLVPVAAIGLLSLVGLLTGLLGWKFSDSKGMAKIAILLNGAVVGCFLLVILGFLIIRFLR